MNSANPAQPRGLARKRVGWVTFGVLMATLAITAPVRSLHAAPIEYSFTPDATATDSLGNLEAISGTFYYDDTTELLTSPDITLTGPGSESGTYTIAQYDWLATPTAGVNGNGIENAAQTSRVDLFLPSILDPDNTNLLVNPRGTFYYWVTENYSEATYYQSVTGGVSAPEPASMALFGVGLLGLRVVRRRRISGRPISRSATSPQPTA
jgi:hypothetical protein